MLIDLHAHSAGISQCCKISGYDNMVLAKGLGIDGFVLTNHYQRQYLINDDINEFAARYIEEYKRVKELGEELGFKIIFGIEVTMHKYNDTHMLIYGVDEGFVLKYPDMFDYTQEELYKLVKEANGIMVQPHPFRKGKNVLLDIKYLDGVEVNCHPKYLTTSFDEVYEVAQSNKLILTCGGDFHNDTYRPTCGMILPDDINDSFDLKNYLTNAEKLTLCIHEVNEEKYRIFEYEYN